MFFFSVVYSLLKFLGPLVQAWEVKVVVVCWEGVAEEGVLEGVSVSPTGVDVRE